MRPPFTPREYQKEAISRTLDLFEKGEKKQLMVVATGLGKTAIAASIAKYFLEKNLKVMFIAHREELLFNAETDFKWVIGENIQIGYEMAAMRSTPLDQVIMVSVQSIGRENSPRLHHFHPYQFGAIITDECHHASSSSYQTIFKHFYKNPNILHLGVTATPNRTDKQSLSHIYSKVSYKLDIVEATKRSLCVPPVSYRVHSKTDLRNVRTSMGDFSVGELSRTINNNERNTLIVETYLRRFRDKKGLVFAADLDHAQRLTDEFKKVGVKAEKIAGDTDKEFRRWATNAFQNQEIDLLLNYSIFTEGYNAPHCDLIIQARPTQSQLLLIQILGRATRLWQNKTQCHIVEIIDYHSDKTQTVAQIFGFIKNFDCENHDYKECMELAQSMQSEKTFFNPWVCSSYTDMVARFENATPQNPRGEKLKPRPQFTHSGSVGERINKPKPDFFSTFKDPNFYYESRYRYIKLPNGDLQLDHFDKNPTNPIKMRILITQNAIGTWDGIILFKNDPLMIKPGPSTMVFNHTYPTYMAAAKSIETIIASQYPQIDILLNINAGWRQRAHLESCSDKQYALISKYRLSTLPKDQITKADASNLIDAFFKAKQSARF